MHHVQTAGQTHQPGLAGPIFKTARPQVVEKAHLIRWAKRGTDNIQMSVAIEVIDQRSSREFRPIQSDKRGDVREPADVIVRGEHARRNQPFRGHLIRVLAQGHGDNRVQPAPREIVRVALHESFKHGFCQLRILANLVDTPHRARGRMHESAV
jgi:hypothetical protein